MPTRPLSDDVLTATLAARDAHPGNTSAAARALGIDGSTFRNRIHRAAERGLLGTEPVLPGFAIKSTSTQYGSDGELQREWVRQGKEPGAEFQMPEGQELKGVSALVDAEGRELFKWVKTRKGSVDPAAIAETIKAAFADYKPARPRGFGPKQVQAELLTLVPLADWHVGLFSWGRETGNNWDLKIAERVIGESVEELIAQTRPSGRAVVLGGGDLLHNDNSLNRTAHSGNALDVDGRWPKVLMTACRLVVRTVDACLARHGAVTVRILPGNHDEHSSVAVAYFLSAYFRAEKRVEVDLDPSLFWWHRHGRVLLGATHGHTVKLAKMPEIMAHRRAEDWGATRFRYVHGFHLHHSAKLGTEGGGVISEIHQTPTPQDAWHFGSGFLSGRSLQAITYHRDTGEKARCRVAIPDAGAISQV